MKGISFVVILLLAPLAQAEAYRCNVNGQVVYQESPCSGLRKPPAKSPAIEEMSAAQIQAEFDREVAAEARRKAEGYLLAVPSDAGATYWVMDKDAGKSPLRTITTRRVGSSGTTWSRRLYNCADFTTKYMGSSDTREKMEKSTPDPKMANVLPGTIADYVGREACVGFNVASIAASREGELAAANQQVATLLAKANSKDDYFHISRAEGQVKRLLKDPDSASFRNVRVSWLSGNPVVCGQVNAKNGFGGYAGFGRFVAGGSDIAVLESGMAAGEMEKLWSQVCGYRN